MGRGIVESGKFRTERVGMELRTSDPAITKEGDAWIRTDIAPKTDQLATLRFDGGASTFDLPIFDSAASVTNVEKVWRIPIGGTIGFIPLAAAGESGAYPQIKYQHGGNALDGHDSLEVRVIPDSELVGDAEDNDLSTESPWDGWNRDTGALSSQIGTVLSGNRTYELVSSNTTNEVRTTRDTSDTLDYSFEIQIDNQVGTSNDQVTFEIWSGGANTGTRIGLVVFGGNGDLGWGDELSPTVFQQWNINTKYTIAVFMDYQNDEATIEINGTEYGPEPFKNSASSSDGIVVHNATNSSGGSANVYYDDVYVE